MQRLITCRLFTMGADTWHTDRMSACKPLVPCSSTTYSNIKNVLGDIYWKELPKTVKVGLTPLSEISVCVVAFFPELKLRGKCREPNQSFIFCIISFVHAALASSTNPLSLSLSPPHSSSASSPSSSYIGTHSRVHTLLQQIASHLYSVVLHAATRTDGSHSCLLNYAQIFLDSENEECEHTSARGHRFLSLDPTRGDGLEFNIRLSSRTLLLRVCCWFCRPAPL